MTTQTEMQQAVRAAGPKFLSGPKVAVLIGVCRKDTLELFRRAVDSLLSQEYPSELIHIYLGIDGPVNVEVDEYIRQNGCFYKVIHNKRNAGLTKTLNRLIAALEDEEFVFRMDADDISLPWRFKSQVTFLQTHTDIDIVGGGIMEIDEEGRGFFSRRYPANREDLCKYICKANPVAHVSVCFRREFFGKISRYPQQYRMNQDLALWYRALSKGIGITNIDECLVKVRVSDELLLRRGFRNALLEFAIYIEGIWLLYGVTWRYFYPIVRLAMRLLPAPLVLRIYRSKIRFALNQQSPQCR